MTEIKSICVYTGKSGRVDQSFKDLAFNTGKFIAEQGWQLVYGGSKAGTMGLVADGALSANGRVVGIIPEFLHQHVERQHTGLTELVVVEDMHERKKMLADRADGFLILPGGFGTLDEFFEILTWRQISLHDKPIVIMNPDGFWDPLITLIKHMRDTHYVLPEHMTLFRVIDNLADFPEALKNNQPDRRNHYNQWT